MVWGLKGVVQGLPMLAVGILFIAESDVIIGLIEYLPVVWVGKEMGSDLLLIQKFYQQEVAPPFSFVARRL